MPTGRSILGGDCDVEFSLPSGTPRHSSMSESSLQFVPNTGIWDLSEDCLSVVCSFLAIKEIATLYGTNVRILCSKLVSPGVVPKVTVRRDIVSQTARMLHENTGMLSCSLDLSRQPSSMLGPRPVNVLPWKLLLHVNAQHLEDLSIHGLPWVSKEEASLQPVDSFASLFPNLKHLQFFTTDLTSTCPSSELTAKLLSTLPTGLETLTLDSHLFVTSLDCIPRSLTSLSLNSPRLIETLGKPSVRPVMVVSHFLSKNLPNLTRCGLFCPKLDSHPLNPKVGVSASHAGVDVKTAELSNQSGELPLPEIGVQLFPKLESLEIYSDGYSPEMFELIESVPTLYSIVLELHSIRLGSSATQIKFPKHLTSLTVREVNRGHPLELVPNFFLSLPAGLTDLQLDYKAHLKFDFTDSNEYNAIYPPEPRFDSSLLSSYLPSRITSFASKNAAGDLMRLQNNNIRLFFGGRIPALPIRLTSLKLDILLSPTEISYLPRELQQLEIGLDGSWTEKAVGEMMDHLGRCTAKLLGVVQVNLCDYDLDELVGRDNESIKVDHASLLTKIMKRCFNRVSTTWAISKYRSTKKSRSNSDSTLGVNQSLNQSDPSSQCSRFVNRAKDFTFHCHSNSSIVLADGMIETVGHLFPVLEKLEFASSRHDTFQLERMLDESRLAHLHTLIATTKGSIGTFKLSTLPRSLTILKLVGWAYISASCTASDLPRGLKQLWIPNIDIPFTDPISTWPQGITSLSLLSTHWLDTELYQLKMHLKGLTEFESPFVLTSSLTCSPSSYTVEWMRSAISMCNPAVPLDETFYKIQGQSSLQRSLFDTLYCLAPLKAPSFSIKQTTLNHLSQTALDLSLILDHRLFRVRESIPPPSRSAGPPRPYAVSRVWKYADRSFYHHAISLDGIDFNCLTFNKNLTSLELLLAEITPTILQNLPPTLKNLSIIASSTHFEKVVHLLPSCLESLTVDSQFIVDFGKQEMSLLPRTLTLLRCSQLRFHPSTIVELPASVTDLSISGYSWTDASVRLLVHHLHDMKALSFEHRSFSLEQLWTYKSPTMDTESVLPGSEIH